MSQADLLGNYLKIVRGLLLELLVIMASPADLGISSQLRMEQKHATCISFCIKLHKSPKEKIYMLESAFGKNMMADRTVRHWHKLFIDGGYCLKMIK